MRQHVLPSEGAIFPQIFFPACEVGILQDRLATSEGKNTVSKGAAAIKETVPFGKAFAHSFSASYELMLCNEVRQSTKPCPCADMPRILGKSDSATFDVQ